MDWAAAAFQENTNLGQALTGKIFLFLAKAVAAMAYLFVLGYIAAGGTITGGISLFLIVGFVLDLIPDLIMFYAMDDLPNTVQNIEYLQYMISVFAYIILGLTLFVATPNELFLGFASFTIVWLLSFILQESTMFLADIQLGQ